MTINYYVGTNGPSIEGIHCAQDLYDALDALDTMVMDSIGEDSPLRIILTCAMDRLLAENEEVEPT